MDAVLPAVRIRAYSAEKLRLLCGGPSPLVVECSRVASPINAGLRPPPTAADGIDRGCHTAAICLQEVDGKVRSAYPPPKFHARKFRCAIFTRILTAIHTQGLADWIGSHTRTFAFFDGVSAMVVSDNLKSGITKACFYEPAVNRTYAEMAAHYDTAVVPARPNKPRDKAKVEVAVQVATRWIIAKLRNRRFFSLGELNAAIAELVTALNNRVTRHLGASRRALFDDLERSALKKLPAEPYAYAEWKECRAGLDYHVEIEKHYYSVPHALLRETMWARITARTIEVFHRGKRVAAHVRSSSNRQHTTVREHMPSSHQRYADWTPERIQRQANEIGPKTSALVEIILRERTHPEQGFRACIGILRHAKSFGRERLEAACDRALEIGARSYTSVTSILKTNLDRKRPAPATDGPAIAHTNIRGSRYFH